MAKKVSKTVSKTEFKKTAAARTVDISQTQWVGGKKAGFGVAGPKNMAGRLYGPKGRFYTGTVNLGEGKTAVYKEGKRVKPGQAVSSPQSSSGSAKTSSSTPVVETTTLPKVTGGDALSRSLGAGRKVGSTSGTSSSAAPAGISSSANFSKGPKTKSAELRRRQAAKTRTARTQQRRAAQRQSGVRTALGLSNPLTAPATLSAILTPKISRAGKSAATSAKNWWEGK